MFDVFAMQNLWSHHDDTIVNVADQTQQSTTQSSHQQNKALWF